MILILSYVLGQLLYLVITFLFLFLQIHVFGYGADKDGNWSHYWEKLHNKRLKTGVHPGNIEYEMISELSKQQKIQFYPGWWFFFLNTQRHLNVGKGPVDQSERPQKSFWWTSRRSSWNGCRLKAWSKNSWLFWRVRNSTWKMTMTDYFFFFRVV